MTDFQSGDLVEAMKGTSFIRDRVSPGLFLEQVNWSVSALLDQGWEVKLIERPVIRPTEPGWYLIEHPEASPYGPIAVKLWGTTEQRWSNGWDHEPLTDDWLRGVTSYIRLYPVKPDDVRYLSPGTEVTVRFLDEAPADALVLVRRRPLRP